MKHLIKIESTPHGVLGVRHAGFDQQYCEAGELVTIEWQPDAKWGLQEAHYTDAGGNVVAIDLTPVKVNGKDVVVFTMPDDNITVDGTFKRFVLEDWTGDSAESPIFNEHIDATDQQRNTALANVSNQTANSSTGKMGYKVLDPTKTFASQVTAENTIYEIRDVFDLGENTTFVLPANVVLKFVGGSINNGTLKAATNSYFNIDYISGGGLQCNLSNNDFSEVRLSWFGVNENSDSEYNREVLEHICSLSSKVDNSTSYDNLKSMPLLIVDIPIVKVSHHVTLRRNLLIDSISNTGVLSTTSNPTIIFEGDSEYSGDNEVKYNSGFVWPNAYSPFNSVKNVAIESIKHCLYLQPANSVYYSKFENLLLKSNNGDGICKISGSNSVFSCNFTNIVCKVPNGHAVNGAYSINNYFTNIKISGESGANPKLLSRAAVSVFNNCVGVIRECNIGDMNIEGFCTFDNNMNGYERNINIERCNIEQINGPIFNSNNTLNSSFNVVIKESTIYFYNTSEKGFPNGVDFDLIQGKDIRRVTIDIKNTLPVMASGYRIARTIYYGAADALQLDGNVSFIMYYSAGDGTGGYGVRYYNPVIKTDQAIDDKVYIVPKYKGLNISDKLVLSGKDVGEALWPTKTEYTYKMSAQPTIYIGVYEIVKIELVANISQWNYIQKYTTITYQKSVIINTSNSYYIGLRINGTNRRLDASKSFNVMVFDKIVLMSDDWSYGYGLEADMPTTGVPIGFRFFREDLNVFAVYNGTKFTKEDGSVLAKSVGTTSERPSLGVDDAGFQYFDKTLGKFICWNGTDWVNLDGTALS